MMVSFGRYISEITMTFFEEKKRSHKLLWWGIRLDISNLDHNFQWFHDLELREKWIDFVLVRFGPFVFLAFLSAFTLFIANLSLLYYMDDHEYQKIEGDNVYRFDFFMDFCIQFISVFEIMFCCIIPRHRWCLCCLLGWGKAGLSFHDLSIVCNKNRRLPYRTSAVYLQRSYLIFYNHF